MATYRIGRSDQNDIVLGDTTVSRQHAELEEVKRGRYVLRDLESTYGTRVFRDGEWLDIIEVEVTDDTEVTLGEYRSLIGDLVALAAPAGAATPAANARAPASSATSPSAGPAGRPAASTGTGMDRRTAMFILLGGGALLLIVVVAAVLVLLLDGSDASPGSRSTATIRGAPTGDATRAQFEAALIRSCSGRNRYNDKQCRCIARQLAQALSREELAIFVALSQAGSDDAKKREIMERFGMAKVMAIGVRMTAVTQQIQDTCGVRLNR